MADEGLLWLVFMLHGGGQIPVKGKKEDLVRMLEEVQVMILDANRSRGIYRFSGPDAKYGAGVIPAAIAGWYMIEDKSGQGEEWRGGGN